MPRSFLVKTHQSSKRLTYGGMKTHTDEAPCSMHAVSLIHTDILPHHHHHHHHLLTQSPWLQQETWSLSSSSVSGSPPSPNTSPLSIFGRSMEAHSRSPVEACKTAESYTKINLEIQCVTGDHMSKEGPFPPSLPLLAVFPETSDQVSFDCLDCHRKCFNFSGLDKHQRLQLQCEWSSRKTFKCKYCEKEYESLGALKMHIRTHTLPCVCKLCGKAFSRPWLLQGHIRTHTGEKPFSCLHCSRAFADRSNLRAHLQTHSDVKKYQCASCFKTFSRISLLAKHQEAGCPCPDSLGGPLHTHVLSNC